ncbi:MAG TPA: Gfo/Idh/MocA family oxidoreductase [Puia sp.]|nr:Gfo/Idh/MocA family oxidoreductase [Puia sp.]
MTTSRRDFVRNVSLASAGLLASPAMVSPMAFANKLPATTALAAKDRIRLGVIGTGFRGESHISLALRRPDVEIVALCDVDAEMLRRTSDIFQKAGKPMPKVFTGDPHAYRDLLATNGLDAVIIATPWEWHTPMVLDAIAAGIKYVATEVVLGITLQDHWDVVNAAERAKANVMMLENVCYRRDVMAALNMVRKGIFGELLHLQGGYQHDLRGVLFNDGKPPYDKGVDFGPKAFSEARWRTDHSVHRNGDLYPTHGIGPLAMMIDINRGNRFLSLSSFSSKTRGLHNYIVKNGGENHPNAAVRFRMGDVVTTQLHCANGETVLLQHDTFNPRPYSLGFRVQGTNGLWMDVANSVYIEGASKSDEWDPAQTWFAKYDHPLWQRYSKNAEGAGHGGMDFFVLNAFVESAKRGVPTPQDVYDAAAWSVITPLSEASIEAGFQPMPFPDFTHGNWMYRKNDFALGDDY